MLREIDTISVRLPRASSPSVDVGRFVRVTYQRFGRQKTEDMVVTGMTECAADDFFTADFRSAPVSR